MAVIASSPDPLARRSADTYSEMGDAFKQLLITIDDLVVGLGGTEWARAIVTRAAREEASRLKAREFSWENGRGAFGRHTALCEAFVLSYAGMRQVGAALHNTFRVRDDVALVLAAAFPGGNLTIRGELMFFETATAAVLLGQSYRDRYYRARREGDERWTTALTEAGRITLDMHGVDAPFVATTHCKSRPSAINSLTRYARECFRVELQPVDPRTHTAA